MVLVIPWLVEPLRRFRLLDLSMKSRPVGRRERLFARRFGSGAGGGVGRFGRTRRRSVFEIPGDSIETGQYQLEGGPLPFSGVDLYPAAVVGCDVAYYG